MENSNNPESSQLNQKESGTTTHSRIIRLLSPTPSLEFILSNSLERYCETIKCENNTIEIEHQHPYILSEEDIMAAWNNIHKSLRVHRWKDIRSLTVRQLSFLDCSNLLCNMFKEKISPSFQGLRCFEIYFKTTAELTNNSLINSIRKLGWQSPCLKQLKLHISLDKVINQGLKTFGFEIGSSLPHLTSLVLGLNSSSYIDNQGLEDFINQICSRLPKLKHFTLELHNFCEISDKGFKKLGTIIFNRVLNLSSFKLIIVNCRRTTDDALQNFLFGLDHPLENLKDFFLHFDRLTDEALETLGVCFAKYMTNLHKIILDCTNCYWTTVKGINDFGSMISNHMDNLQHFTWNFTGLHTTIDMDLKIIANKVLLGLPSLTSLELIFSGCPKITDVGLEALGSVALPKLIHLNRLKLDFSGSENITAHGLKKLGLDITTYAPKLLTLALVFKRCPLITDYGVEDMAGKITTGLADLQEFTLDFSSCQSVTSSSLEVIASKTTNHLTKLECLILAFENCHMVTEQAKAKALETLQYIPNLTIS